MKVADAEVRIVRASNYVRVVEEALRKTVGGNAELEEELGRARDELASATRQREEGEAEQRLADALLQRSFGVQACMLQCADYTSGDVTWLQNYRHFVGIT